MHLRFSSNYLGDVPTVDTSVPSNNHISQHGFSVPELDNNIKGSGKIPLNLTTDFNFKYIKTIDKKFKHSFFGIIGNNLIYSDNIYSNESNLIELSKNNLTNGGLNNITSTERNSNSYLGLGASQGAKTKWLGHIERKQLERDINEVALEDAECHRPNKRMDVLDLDQTVIPLLHSGMNSTNSMIAGAASLYGSGSTAADFG